MMSEGSEKEPWERRTSAIALFRYPFRFIPKESGSRDCKGKGEKRRADLRHHCSPYAPACTACRCSSHSFFSSCAQTHEQLPPQRSPPRGQTKQAARKQSPPCSDPWQRWPSPPTLCAHPAPCPATFPPASWRSPPLSAPGWPPSPLADAGWRTLQML